LRRGEKGIKDAGKILFTDAATGILDLDYRFVTKLFRLLLANIDRDTSFILNGFNRVDNKIENGVFDLRSVGIENYIFCRSLKLYLNAPAARGSANRLRTRNSDCLQNQVCQRCLAGTDCARPGATEQRAHGAVYALNFMTNSFERFPLRIVRIAAANQNVDGALNSRQRIFHFMRQPSREFTHERDLSCALQFRLQSVLLSHVRI